MSICGKWALITLLSIMIPMSLMVTFRLTGILQEPMTPETTTVEAVSWSFPRPSSYVRINQRIENSYSDGKASVGLGVHITMYFENAPELPFGGNDGLIMGLSVLANVSEGFIHSIVVKFQSNNDLAFLDIFEDPDVIELHNVKLEKIWDWQKESYIEGYGVDKPKYGKATIIIFWVFLDDNSVDHGLTISFEGTYFDGTGYRKTRIPINLKAQKP